jgi:preprotein translocase subunit SecA
MQGGQHQAVEQKEHVTVTEDTRAMASVTYQNLFRMFKKLAGMSGTAKTDEDELLETYNTEVVVIPTNRPIQRIDYPDQIYLNLISKLAASIQEVKEIHATGRPILIGTGSVTISEIYSQMLLNEGIAHNVLNARNAAREAMIVKEAGQVGAVTVATSMAGRGTDIKLGPGVSDLGGLAMIITERMQSKRIDNQYIGRAGRQGDEGSSKFFVSLEDDILFKNGPDWVKKYIKKNLESFKVSDDKQLKQRKFKKLISKAQKGSEGSSRQSRMQTLEFDENFRIQRNMVYQMRDQITAGEIDLDKLIESMAGRVFDDYIEDKNNLTPHELLRYLLDTVSYRTREDDPILSFKNKKDLKKMYVKKIKEEID